MNPAWIALTGGLAAFAHCMGMCGGFALHLSQGASGRAVLGRQFLWHGGRIATYVFLGALAAFAGTALTASPQFPWAQNALAWGAGIVMILMGLTLLGLVPWRSSPAASTGGLLGALLDPFFRKPNAPASFVLGLVTGLLPCPVALGFLALAAQERSVPTGMAIMAALGLGTMGPLLLVGLTGAALRPRLRRWGAVLGGCIVIGMGIVTVLRGAENFHSLLGCHDAPYTPCPHCGPSSSAGAVPSSGAGILPASAAAVPAAEDSRHEPVQAGYSAGETPSPLHSGGD